MQASTFFDLLRFSLGIVDQLETEPTDADWQALFEQADQQSLVGVFFHAIERLPKERQPKDKQIRFTWLAASEMLGQANKTINEHAAAIVKAFEADGFGCCLLKGQGNALLYPNPALRNPGDIDLWVTRDGKTAVREVLSYVRKKSAKADKAVYHHIDYGEYEGTEIEIHYRPSFMHQPWHNRQLQRFFEREAQAQASHRVAMGGGEVSVPTLAFNRIYLLVHITRHLLQHGIGLRQFVDYYYVLRQDITPQERTYTTEVLRQCGLTDAAGAVMYVMQQLFWLDDDHLIAKPDEWRGRFVLQEIMLGGNFGMYDKRVSQFARTTSIGHNIQRLRHDWRTLRYFPSESLWEPIFRLWHFVWRLSPR